MGGTSSKTAPTSPPTSSPSSPLPLAGAAFRRRVVLFGDSITQLSFDPDEKGWGAQLQHAYQRKADVIARGYSGYNVRLALRILPYVFPPAGKEDGESEGGGSKGNLFATVFFGANDAVDNTKLPEGKPAQGIPVEEYESGLGTIVDAALKSGFRAVLVISPPPVDTARWPDRTNDRVREYTAACKRVVESRAGSGRVGLVNLVEVMLPAAAEEEEKNGYFRYLNDGLHLAAPGNAVVAAEVMRVLGELKGAATKFGLLPDELPLDFPIWRDIDPVKPEKELGEGALRELHGRAEALRK